MSTGPSSDSAEAPPEPEPPFTGGRRHSWLASHGRHPVTWAVAGVVLLGSAGVALLQEQPGGRARTQSVYCGLVKCAVLRSVADSSTARDRPCHRPRPHRALRRPRQPRRRRQRQPRRVRGRRSRWLPPSRHPPLRPSRPRRQRRIRRRRGRQGPRAGRGRPPGGGRGAAEAVGIPGHQATTGSQVAATSGAGEVFPFDARLWRH
jgi:hypothetical protein